MSRLKYAAASRSRTTELDDDTPLHHQMSLRAKSTFYGSLAVCGLTVLGVHYLQKNERAVSLPDLVRERMLMWKM